MKKKPSAPPLPAAACDTDRHRLVAAMEDRPRSAKELSAEAGIPEKDVYRHLEHIRKSEAAAGRRMIVTPAECRKCGFIFKKRERLTKPGKCPVCRGQSLRDPLFSLGG